MLSETIISQTLDQTEDRLHQFFDPVKSQLLVAGDWGDRVTWIEWSDANPKRITTDKKSDYDPRGRPWFGGALALSARADNDDAVFWTEPYIFVT